MGSELSVRARSKEQLIARILDALEQPNVSERFPTWRALLASVLPVLSRPSKRAKPDTDESGGGHLQGLLQGAEQAAQQDVRPMPRTQPQATGCMARGHGR